MFYEVTEACAGCTMCVKRCPTGAISGERRGQHAIDPSVCKGCGACWRQCPKAAILDPVGRRRRGKPARELPRASIDRQVCVGCRNCQLVCPFEAIRFRRWWLPALPTLGVCEVLPERCLGCASCVAVCPTGAASIAAAPPAETAPRPAGARR